MFEISSRDLITAEARLLHDIQGLLIDIQGLLGKIIVCLPCIASYIQNGDCHCLPDEKLQKTQQLQEAVQPQEEQPREVIQFQKAKHICKTCGKEYENKGGLMACARKHKKEGALNNVV